MNYLETKVRPILEDTISKLKGEGDTVEYYEGGMASGVNMIKPAKEISLALEEWVVNTDPEANEELYANEIRQFLKTVSVNRQIIFAMGVTMLSAVEKSMDRHALLSALRSVSKEFSGI